MKSFLLVLFISFITFNSVQSQPTGIGVWSQSFSNTARVYSMSVSTSNQNTVYIGTLDAGVYKTTNAGLNWVQMNNGMTYNHVQCIAVAPSNNNVIYAGTDSLGGWTTSGIYKSTDAGANWILVSQDIYDSKGIQAIIVHPTNPNIAYCGVFNALATSAVGLWKTTNGGLNWFASSTGMDNKQVLALAFNPLNPNVIYVGTSMTVPSSSTGPCKIFKTYNAGATWFEALNGIPQLSTDNNPIRCLSVSNVDTSLVLAGIFMNATGLTGGMYVSTNGGLNWTQRHSGLTNATGTLPRSCLIRPGSTTEFYVGMDNSSTTTAKGVYVTTNAGLNWTSFNTGVMLNTYAIRAMAFKTTGNPTLFAGDGGTATANSGSGVYEYSWLASGVGNQNTGIPNSYDLSQNYPNPFNPVTKISYQLPEAGYVNITVYDMLGREVFLLANGYKNAGYYSLDFNASKLSGGVYFYRMNTDKFTSTKKMILIK